jgi:hypothetical protein
MKKIIICVFVIAHSPLAIAESYEDIPTSKESVYSPDAFKGNTKTDKANKDLIDGEKPRLENFASYNDFLKAMYVYKKNEEETIRPNVDIKLPSSKVKNGLEYTPIEGNKEITIWGEELPSEYVILGE